MKVKHKQGDVSIILAVVLMSMLLIIGLGVSVLMFQQLKMSGQIGRSTVAFFAADAGAEKCLYQVFRHAGTGCDNPAGGSTAGNLDINGAKYSASYKPGMVNVVISVGQYSDTIRALQLVW